MRAYSNEEDDGLSSRSKVFLDTEKEEDKVRSVFIEENDMETISIDKHKHILNSKWIQTEFNTFKKNFDEIKQICLKLYNVLQVNICRVDFYITTKGVIIGELTVRSGNLYRGWNIKVKNILHYLAVKIKHYFIYVI